MSIVSRPFEEGSRLTTGRCAGPANLHGGGVLSARISRDQVSTPRLSLNAMLQSESVQMIKDSLTELARFADQFPPGHGQDACAVNSRQLLAMIRRSRDISSSLDKIGSLREQSMPDVATTYVPMKPLSFVARKRRQERLARRRAHKCHNCKTDETPLWRPGPDGPRSLCNVCGLVYSKRKQRAAEQTVRMAK